MPALLLLAACTSYESHYEKSVYHLEPIYCYQTIGTVDCRREPNARDADRLVNYYGPAPSKYDPPDPPRLNELQAPPDGPGYWRDPEPIPGPPGESEEWEGEEDAADEPADAIASEEPEPPASHSGPRVLLPAPPPPSAPDAEQHTPPDDSLTDT